MTDKTLATLDLSESVIDVDQMYEYRLSRVQQALAQRNIAAMLT